MKTDLRCLAVFDFDSTLIHGEVIEFIAAHRGKEAEVERITSAAMRGEIDFATSLRQRVAMLKGLPLATLKEVASTLRTQPGVTEFMDFAREHEWKTAVVSGAFSEVIADFCYDLGFDWVRANGFSNDGSVLDGRLRGPIIDAKAKADALIEFAGEAGIEVANTLAFGDGANDIEMFAIAGCAISVNGHPIAEAHADIQLRDQPIHTAISPALEMLAAKA